MQELCGCLVAFSFTLAQITHICILLIWLLWFLWLPQFKLDVYIQAPLCEMIRFSTQFSAEILRELLLPEQRIRIHETAARVLEKQIMHYDFCCKKEFFGNVFKIRAMGETVGQLRSIILPLNFPLYFPWTSHYISLELPITFPLNCLPPILFETSSLLHR